MTLDGHIRIIEIITIVFGFGIGYAQIHDLRKSVERLEDFFIGLGLQRSKGEK